MKFDLVWFAEYTSGQKRVHERIGPFNNILSAIRRRKLSGQILVYSGTNNVVPNDFWLWPWEVKKKNQSYAWKEVEKAKRDQTSSQRGEEKGKSCTT